MCSFKNFLHSLTIPRICIGSTSYLIGLIPNQGESEFEKLVSSWWGVWPRCHSEFWFAKNPKLAYATLWSLIPCLVCSCCCLAEVSTDGLMSCWPTVLTKWDSFLPQRHLLWAWIIYLFIQHNRSIILAAEQYYLGKPHQPPCCVWKLILLFIPVLPAKSTVTCSIVSPLPWGTHISRELSLTAPTVARMWEPVNTKCY